MIPFPLVLQFVCMLLCTSGYVLLTTKHKRLGFLLGAIGSVGWILVAPSPAIVLQSIVFLWGSIRGYEQCR